MTPRFRAHACAFAVAGLAAAAAVAPAHAIERPALVFQMGHTFAVGSAMKGAYDGGGYTTSFGLLWPWEDRFRFGVTLEASDFGSRIEDITLADAGGGPSRDYGSVELGHRGSWGGSWRADAVGPGIGLGWRSYATAHYGYVRYRYDRVGHPLGAQSAVGGGLGFGADHAFGTHHSIGVSVAQTWMSEEFTRRFASAALEWRWRW